MRLALRFLLLAIPTVLATNPTWADDPTPGIFTLRLAYFPNITHSQALIGLAGGDFSKALGPRVKIEATAFNAGPSVIEALFAGKIDIAYIGPNPAINGYVKSRGEALRIVAGATSAGAALIVRKNAGIRSAAELGGKILATPQIGNTQDIATRSYLRSLGLAPREKGGTVAIQPMDNPTILDAFRQGRIDGAWVPEPWASRLEIEGDGLLLLDERSLWPDGRFSTAVLVASSRMLREHPDVVRAFIAGHVAVTRWELAHPEEARLLINKEIARLTGKALSATVLERAWGRMTPTWDPLATTLERSTRNALDAGFLKSMPDLSGLVAIEPLNSALADANLPALR